MPRPTKAAIEALQSEVAQLQQQLVDERVAQSTNERHLTQDLATTLGELTYAQERLAATEALLATNDNLVVELDRFVNEISDIAVEEIDGLRNHILFLVSLLNTVASYRGDFSVARQMIDLGLADTLVLINAWAAEAQEAQRESRTGAACPDCPDCDCFDID